MHRVVWLSAVLIASLVLSVLLIGRPEAPASPDEAIANALAALDKGKLSEAQKWTEALKAKAGESPEYRLLQSMLTLRRGDPEGALRKVAAVPAEGQLQVPARLLQGECLYHLGRLSEAQTVFGELAAQVPAHPEPHRWLAAIYYDLGACDAAIVELQRLAELRPEDFAPHRLLGLIYSDFRFHEKAILAYRQALDRAPPVVVRNDVIRELSTVLVAEREYEQALQLLEEAPPDGQTLGLRAECLWNSGFHDEAQKVLEDSRLRGHSGRQLELMAARVSMSDDRYREAIRSLESALRRDPHDAECRYQLAMCYQHLGDRNRSEQELAAWQQSKALLDQLTELNLQAVQNPADAEVRFRLAEVCTQLERPQLAEMWLRAAQLCQASADANKRTSNEASDQPPQ